LLVLMRRDARPALTVTLCLASLALDASQDPATFQRVSIRPAAGVGVVVNTWRKAPPLTVLDDRVEARRVTVVDLARVAYGFENLHPDRVVRSGVGVWTERVQYDVTATSDRPWTRAPAGDRVPRELRLMLRTLLEERFALAARVEDRPTPAYALRMVQPGVLGPGLKPSSNTCLGPYMDPSPDGHETKPRCPFSRKDDAIEEGAVTMAEFAYLLSDRQRRPIVDDTHLEGRYDIVLTVWPAGRPRPSEAEDAAAELYTTAFRAAMRSQLGLEIRTAKLPLRTLVITRARQPLLD
jgi:uncharacterized protein (TIGR03435 family)